MGLLAGEFTDKDLNCIPKVIQVLKYLNQGRELKLGDYTYRLGETQNNGFNLLFKMDCSSNRDNNDTHEEWFGYQGNLMHFSGMCNNLSDFKLTTMAAEMTLTEINKRG